MGRKNYSQRRGQAQKERRHNKVIQAWRMIDPEISSRLSGTMHELERDGAIPALQEVKNSHRVFIVDPRLVRSEMSAGFELGFNYARAMASLYESDTPQGPTAKLGEIAVVGKRNKRLIILNLESPDLELERTKSYDELGDVGMRGFQNARKNRRNSSQIDIVLGITKEPLMSQEKLDAIKSPIEGAVPIPREETVQAIEDALTVHGLYQEIVELGPLHSTTWKPS